MTALKWNLLTKNTFLSRTLVLVNYEKSFVTQYTGAPREGGKQLYKLILLDGFSFQIIAHSFKSQVSWNVHQHCHLLVQTWGILSERALQQLSLEVLNPVYSLTTTITNGDAPWGAFAWPYPFISKGHLLQPLLQISKRYERLVLIHTDSECRQNSTCWSVSLSDGTGFKVDAQLAACLPQLAERAESRLAQVALWIWPDFSGRVYTLYRADEG